MKNIIIALTSIIVFNLSLFSQNSMDRVLIEIEKNNTTLSALRKSIEADKISNRTGIYIQNPEVDFNYLWGNPAAIGNRTDVSITQTFDFPTAYKYKSQIADIKNEQIELEYQKQLKITLLQTSIICSDLIYTNALKIEYSERLDHAQSIADSYKSKFNIGEINILDYNKAQLNLLNIRKKAESIEVERIALLSELARLNGGISIEYSDSIFQLSAIPGNFEEWYVQAEQNNPILSWLKQEIEISQNQTRLNKAMSLPKFETGYMNEMVVGQQFQGITVGLSIPLWENKNSIKYSYAKTIALECIVTDNKIQLYNHLKTLHNKAIGLQNNANNYRTNLLSFNNTELLKKALNKGEIALIDYIVELSIYYESVNNLLELEREISKTIAELNHYI